MNIQPWEKSRAQIQSLKPLSFGPLVFAFFLSFLSWIETYINKLTLIGHFRVPLGLCFKMRVGAQPLIWKSFFILMQIKLIFIRKVVHLASFWKWGFLDLRSGLFCCLNCCKVKQQNMVQDAKQWNSFSHWWI